MPLDRFSVQTFRAAPASGDAWMVQTARVGRHMGYTVGTFVDYAHEPLVVVNCQSEESCDLGDRRAVLVRSLATLQLAASLGLFDRLQVGLVIPMGMSSGDAFTFERAGMPYQLEGGTRFGLGDPVLIVKGWFWRTHDGATTLGASLWASGPVAHLLDERSYLGDPGPAFGGALLLTYRLERLEALVNLGGSWRSPARLLSTELGPRLDYGLAVAYRFENRLAVQGELVGRSSLRGQLDESPLEGRLGVRYPVGPIALTAAVGGGIVAGAGTPVFRALLGARWAPTGQPDTDRDGVGDEQDACPADPEDRDGFEDDDGCPEEDNDGDGLLDAQDRCPDQAEDRDDFEDDDGCPDTDNDGDGVRDGFDSCPNEPEDKDGDRDDDGCPDRDTDRDGIEDAKDACPNVPEDSDGFGDLDGCPERDFDLDGIDDDNDECPEQPERYDGLDDHDGCPEPDGDGDGVSDAMDRCPEEPETLNGRDDGDGCPDGTPLIERKKEGETELLQVSAPVRFRRGTPVPGLQRALEAVAWLLRRERHLRRLRIELSLPARQAQRRTQAATRIRDALVRLGVEADRLELAEASQGEARLRFVVLKVIPGQAEAQASGGGSGTPPSSLSEGGEGTASPAREGAPSSP